MRFSIGVIFIITFIFAIITSAIIIIPLDLSKEKRNLKQENDKLKATNRKVKKQNKILYSLLQDTEQSVYELLNDIAILKGEK